MVTNVTTAQNVLEQDLNILQEMVIHLDDYLFSDADRWNLGKPGMPPLTLGGCLMRLRRLNILKRELYEEDRVALIKVQADFDEALKESVVRFEQRAYSELSIFLREWINYLRNLSYSTKIAADHEHYENKVDTRVVIGELVSKLSERPYKLDGRVPRDIAAVDRRLRLMWEPGSFIWEPVWREAYPMNDYWWLYGYPQAAA